MRALIVDAIRSPRGKAKETGALHSVKPIELVAQLIAALRERCLLAADAVDDVLVGCVTAVGEQGANLAKIAALYGGLDDATSGSTVNRFCCSGLDALASAAMQIECGVADVVLAGGVESMSRVPMFADRGAWFADPEVARRVGFVHMAQAADLVANLAQISRAELDAFAHESHRRAGDAARLGHFRRSRIDIDTPEGVCDRDELIREELTLDKLAALPSLRRSNDGLDEIARARYPGLDGVEPRHTVGSSPGIADGAALALVASEAAAARHGWTPRARILAIAHHSVEPVQMLTGNVGAVRKLLSRARLSIQDVDLFEINESFAAVPLHFRRELSIADSRLNITGGAIALGHPLGATGGVLLSMLLDNLERMDKRIGVTSICGGAGVATALAVERL